MEKSVQPPPPAGGHGHHSFRGGIAGAHVWVLALLAVGPMLFLPSSGKAQQGGQTSSTPPLTGTGAPAGNCGVGSLYVNTTTGDLYDCNGGSWNKVNGSGSGGSGTVTQVTSGNFPPLFNVSVATNTTTPAFSFATINQSSHTVYGNCTGSTGAPAFCALTAAMLPTLSIDGQWADVHHRVDLQRKCGRGGAFGGVESGKRQRADGPGAWQCRTSIREQWPRRRPQLPRPHRLLCLRQSLDHAGCDHDAHKRDGSCLHLQPVRYALVTWAGITGSPATCTIQIKSSDSVGDLINNGSAISVAPSNGTTSQAFTPAAGSSDFRTDGGGLCLRDLSHGGNSDVSISFLITVYRARPARARLAMVGA